MLILPAATPVGALPITFQQPRTPKGEAAFLWPARRKQAVDNFKKQWT
jgi:hypothetical protein